MLVDSKIASSGIVQQPQSAGERRSTYDATVGLIISNGKDIGSPYTLPPRGVVWVVSAENFDMPDNVTAVAALRTTWAHKGIFALNVGIIDPGWEGPVATALVNFSTEDFSVSLGDPFMRLMFFDHQNTNPPVPAVPQADPALVRAAYIKQVKKNSRDFSKSFLNMEALVDDVSRKIFSVPKMGVVATWFGLIVAVLAIFVPIVISVWSAFTDDKINLAKLQQRIEILDKEDRKIDIEKLQRRVEVLEKEKDGRDSTSQQLGAVR